MFGVHRRRRNRRHGRVRSEAPYAIIHQDGFVHPEHRGRGVGTALLRWAEQRAVQEVSKADPDIQIVMFVLQDDANRSSCELLEDNGYQNMHRVAIGVVSGNARALRFYEKMGFVREGEQRDGYYHDHAYQDFVMMSILEHEFRARR